jgi:hypothetical protein
VEPQSGALFHRWQHVRSFNRDRLAAMLKPFGLNEVVVHEIDFKKEIFAAINKATADAGNIFDLMRPVYFNSRPNLAGVFSKGESSFSVDKVPCNVSMTTVVEVPSDVRLGTPNRWPVTTLPPAWMTYEGESCFVYPLDFIAPFDDVEHPDASVIRLFEDGLQLGPPHASHDEVRRLGAGHYSHWEGKLYFSSSDGSDPRVNGRRYEVRAPGLGAAGDPKSWPSITLSAASLQPEGASCFVCGLDAIELWDDERHTAASMIRLYEDGQLLGPPHASHEEIRRSGGGRYSHWEGRLYFSSSDGSDPRTNGRRYEVRAPLWTRPSVQS